jgi:hypothetical protein
MGNPIWESILHVAFGLALLVGVASLAPSLASGMDESHGPAAVADAAPSGSCVAP